MTDLKRTPAVFHQKGMKTSDRIIILSSVSYFGPLLSMIKDLRNHLGRMNLTAENSHIRSCHLI